MILELYEFDPQKEPWRGYLAPRKEIQTEAELLAEEHEGTQPSDHYKDVAISGLIFEAHELFPYNEVYQRGHPLYSKPDLDTQWTILESLPGEDLPKEIIQDYSWQLFPIKPIEKPLSEKPNKKLLPCELGTNWRQIIITKKANDMVRITTPNGSNL